jgi:hypothetical protein
MRIRERRRTHCFDFSDALIDVAELEDNALEDAASDGKAGRPGLFIGPAN